MSRGIAIIGMGKIARDQHLPAIAASGDFHLAGVVSGHASDLDVPTERTLAELVARVPDLAAVSICTPPMARTPLIEQALALGLDVMVEKPPAATLSEAERFAPMARTAGRSLFLTWHSREANAVAPLADWLDGRSIRSLRIDWKEDVRVWHPGQEWIWQPGIGVFDPGVNALSILTRLLPDVTMHEALLRYPSDRAAPIAADLMLASARVPRIDAAFSFDQRGPQTWSIAIETDDGDALLRDGGARLSIGGVDVAVRDIGEYPGLYRRFAGMVGRGMIEADLAPFRLVADAFMLGRHERVGPFRWND
ncbi:Gfo/Idh/MocA family protein [Sphingomonas sp.]|uniref:Gfo/Idh/MocA family protein n=1 Tax=Sphingomonas sp. TaxID=28214 RepID=UPI002B7CE493|nr:Gfo/Idh/MocA family oxidoreductase [Sphingomonas sp.]HTG37248.1 Gfo/Idh/MocA family oxidoreductase [Sphingomonas sp.]